MTSQELFKLAHLLAKDTAADEGRLLPLAQGRPVVTTGDIVVAAYQLGLDAGEHRMSTSTVAYRNGWRAGRAGRRHAV